MKRSFAAPLLAASVLVAAAARAPAAASGAEDAFRQFDFWVGEWSVQNRHLQPDGTWLDGDVTRARIVPVLGGQAVLEEWAGPFRSGYMNGFSLRAFDPAAERWVILLSWTGDGNSTFGRMRGSFRHGRGEFVAPETGPRRQRYTFSDALADSVRWDSARTTDGGRTWSTDWIMEFSRTRAAAEVDDELLFGTGWNEGQLTPHTEARALDWMLGSWRGHAETGPGADADPSQDAGGRPLEARLRCRLLNKDCLVLDVLETRAAADQPWSGSLHVGGFVPGQSAWESWSLTSDDTRFARWSGRDLVRASDGMRLVYRDPAGATHERLLIPLRTGSPGARVERMRIEEVVLRTSGPKAAESELVRTVFLERVDG